MELTLTRRWLYAESTLGELEVDGEFFCYTLEDTVRAPGIKIKSKTAIPPGRYRVTVTFSNRFKRRMPLLLNVPMFEGIRIHSGNKAVDTEGCILVGFSYSGESVLQSRHAYNALFPKIEQAVQSGTECWITIRTVGGG